MSFFLGSLTDWRSIASGELLVFPVADGDVRQVEFDLMAGAPCTAYAVQGEAVWPVAAGVGRMECRFSVAADTSIYVECDGPCTIRTRVGSQLLGESREASYVKVAPRPAVNLELQRMQQLMRLNMERRLAEMDAQYRQRLAALEAAKPVEAGAETPVVE